MLENKENIQREPLSFSKGRYDLQGQPVQQFGIRDSTQKQEKVKQLQDIAEHSSRTVSQVDQAKTIQKKPNDIGLPSDLKEGMESVSGVALDNVKVHYNSNKPSQVNAHAYAQGTDIHLASGQEKHLPHELGHVVQQAQGRVKPTATVSGVAINDSPTLESEADKLGELALNSTT